MIRRAICGVMLVAVLLGGAEPVLGASEVTWREVNGAKRVDASVPGWPLKKVLARVAAQSGWSVFMEPGLDGRVSVHFNDVSQADALKLLLGGFNYALLPDAKGQLRLLVFSTSLGQATAQIAPEKTKPRNWLANEIIVTLPPGSKADVEKLAAELGGKVVAKSEELNAYRLQFPDAEAAEEARQKLAQRDDLNTEDNYGFGRPVIAGSGSPSLESLFPLDPKPVGQGSQVTVALVDTPLQPLEGKMKDFVLPSVHINGAPASLPEGPTHGTSMAQTLLNSLALSKDANGGDGNLGAVRVLPIDIYGNSPTTTTFEVAQGLYRAIQADAQVINLSLGGTGDSPMVEYLLEQAKKKQIMVFASAGNTPTTDPTWPAASPNAIAVTATDWSGNIAAYANRGSFIDVKAPGSSRVFYNGQTYISTGTSTATAFVSGQAAALAASGVPPAQAAEAIIKNFDVNRPAVQQVPRR
jgi:hypothetical protein